MTYDLRPGEYGACGHHINNIGPRGCALCLADTPWPKVVDRPLDKIIRKIAGRTRNLRRKCS